MSVAAFITSSTENDCRGSLAFSRIYHQTERRDVSGRWFSSAISAFFFATYCDNLVLLKRDFDMPLVSRKQDDQRSKACTRIIKSFKTNCPTCVPPLQIRPHFLRKLVTRSGRRNTGTIESNWFHYEASDK